MMSVQTEGDIDQRWLAHILTNVSSDSKITEILSSDIELAVPAGDNYCSSIYRVKLKCALNNGSERRISVIVKQVISSEQNKFEWLPAIFNVEIQVYSIIFPLMEKLMEEFKDEREKLWCRFYGHIDNRALALEDLTGAGFKTSSRTEWLSFEYSCIALENLARFHAMSKVLIDRGLIEKSDYTQNSLTTDIELGHRLHAGPLEVLAEAILESWGPEWQEVSERIKIQVPTVTRKLNELAKVQDDRYMVFNHGDLWTCNIMVKTGENNSVESMRFLDFQYPCLNSFIWDVTIFLFLSVNPQVRRSELDKLLTVYQKSLEENLRFFHCESHVPTLNDVISESERVRFLAFIFNMTFFPLFSSSKCEPFDISKILDHPPQEVFDRSAFTDERLVPELKEDLKIYIEKGVI